MCLGGVLGGRTPRIRVCVQCESRGDVMDRSGRGTWPPPGLPPPQAHPPLDVSPRTQSWHPGWTLGGAGRDAHPKREPYWGAKGVRWEPPIHSSSSWDSPGAPAGGASCLWAPLAHCRPLLWRGDPKCPSPHPQCHHRQAGGTPQPLPTPPGCGGCMAPRCGDTAGGCPRCPPAPATAPLSLELLPSLGKGGDTQGSPLGWGPCSHPTPTVNSPK